MQELRSSEILDKEILSDAQRKIEHILANADEECEKLLSGVEQRVSDAKKEKESFYERKMMAQKKNLDASLPVEEQRFKVTFIQDSVIDAVNAYLFSLSEEQRIKMLIQDFHYTFDKKIDAYVYGFSVDSVKKILSKELGSNLGNCKKTEFGKIVIENDIGLSKNEGIILETEDKSLRVHLTLVEKVSQILDKNRAELSEALFGQGN